MALKLSSSRPHSPVEMLSALHGKSDTVSGAGNTAGTRSAGFTNCYRVTIINLSILDCCTPVQEYRQCVGPVRAEHCMNGPTCQMHHLLCHKASVSASAQQSRDMRHVSHHPLPGSPWAPRALRDRSIHPSIYSFFGPDLPAPPAFVAGFTLLAPAAFEEVFVCTTASSVVGGFSTM